MAIGWDPKVGPASPPRAPEAAVARETPRARDASPAAPPRRLPEPRPAGTHPSRRALPESTPGLERKAQALHAALRGRGSGPGAAAGHALAFCRAYAARRSRRSRKVALGLLDSVCEHDPDAAVQATALAALLAAEGRLDELTATGTAAALARLVTALDQPTNELAALARALAARAITQLVVDFPEGLAELGAGAEVALAHALGLAEEAVVLAPSLPDAPAALGRVLCHSEGPEALEAAREALERALGLDPDHDPALADSAALELAGGHSDIALVRMDRLLKRGNVQPRTLHLRALALAAAGRLREARRDLERALRLAPDAGRLHLDAAALASRAGDAAAAELHERCARNLLGPAFVGPG